MSDDRKEAEEKMAKAIFISGDGWLAVFDLLAPFQLGLGIALISHRFNYYVDEHFKTRKWTLEFIRIWPNIGENGTNKMEIANNYWKRLPIPQIQLPRKVTGFKCIIISYIDRIVITFLRRFRPLFTSFCPINLVIHTNNDCVLEFILHNIWPMIAKNICGIAFTDYFRRLRKFVPSILSECPSLRFVCLYAGDIFTEFPADDSAMASDGQTLAKWLFTPQPNNVPKVLRCSLDTNDGNWSLRIAAFKAAFTSASSPVNFIVVIRFFPSHFADSVVPFDNLTNELTREQLALKRTDEHSSQCFVLVRSPIARGSSEWAKWEKEAIEWRIYDQRNQINIRIDNEDEIGDGLLNAIPGPSDQLK